MREDQQNALYLDQVVKKQLNVIQDTQILPQIKNKQKNSFQNSFLYEYRNIICGLMHGITQIITGQPLDIIKVRMQSSNTNRSTFQTIYNLIHNEGVAALYKGTLSPLIGNGFLIGIQFGVFEEMKNYFRKISNTTGELPLIYSVLSAMVSGSIQSIIICPMELIRIKQQVRTNRGFGSVTKLCRSIRQNNGLLGFYNGFSSTYIREIIGEVIYFFTYDGSTQQMNNYIETNKREDLKEITPLICGGLAGFVFQVGIYPIDTIKSKLQTDSVTSPKFKGLFDCIKQTKNIGYKQFYKGVQIAGVRGIITNAGGFYVYEKCKSNLEYKEQQH